MYAPLFSHAYHGNVVDMYHVYYKKIERIERIIQVSRGTSVSESVSVSGLQLLILDIENIVKYTTGKRSE